jgi:hypothetical protein
VYPFDHHVAIGAVDGEQRLHAHRHRAVANAPTHEHGARRPATGVYLVAAGTERTVNVASHNVSLYGTAADTISVQAFAAGAAPTVA